MTWERAVNSQYCLTFDGTNDYIEATGATVVGAVFDTGTWSVSFWIFDEDASATSRTPFAIVQSGNANRRIQTILSSGTFTVQSNQSSAGSPRSISAAVASKLWVHVLITSTNGGALNLYVNGRLAATDATAGGSFTTGTLTHLRIGSFPTNIQYWKGKIDDFRVYDRTLTDAEVQSIYRNSSSPPTSGLVCYFPFEEGTGTTTTDTIGGLVGTLTNGPTWQVQVPPRLINGRDLTQQASRCYSLSFDGSNDYVDCGNATQLNFGTGNFTVALWAKWTDTGSGIFVGKDGWALANDNGVFLAQINGQAGKVAYWNGSTNTYAGTGLNDGAWHHIAAVRTGTGSGQVLLYIDGVQVATATDARHLSNSRKLTINGADDNNANSYLACNMKDVRAYASNLSAAQIRTLATGGDVSGAVGKWELNEGTGTTATDSGSGGNNGTLTNGPTWSVDVPQWWRQDKHSWGLTFDGSNDYVSLGTGKINDLLRNASATAVTLSAWVRRTGLDAGQYDNVIFAGRVTSANTNVNLWLSIRGDGANAGKILAGGRSRAADSFQERTSTAVVPADTWTHVACILDFANDMIYTAINGVVESATAVTFGSSTYTEATFSTGYVDSISEQGVVTTYHFQGNIRDVQLFTSALSSANIAKLANNVEPSVSPAARWKLDEGAGTVALDASGNGNNGTLTNGPMYTGDIPQWMRPTIESSHAISLDGTNDYVNCGSDASIDNLASADFTCVAWINLAGSPAGGLNYRIFDKMNVSALSGWCFYVNDSNRYLAAFVDMGISDAAYLSNVSLSLSTWYPVAGIWSSSGNTFRLYNAGVETTYTTSTSGSGTKPDDSSLNLSIGALAPLAARYFNGMIDEPALYRRQLTMAELADIAAGYLVTAGLISRWKLDNNANDSVGSNHGTEQGGATYTVNTPGTTTTRPRPKTIRSGM